MRQRLLRFVLASSAMWCSAVIAQEMPRIDIEASCRQARALSPEDTDPYAGCVRDETAAASQLRATWVESSRSHRESCSQETQIASSPSYVELITCLEMYSGSPSANPRPRRLQARP
ncbi:hypothetical protein AB4Z10_13300 [Bosea sp. RAF48]|uniref:hypothetical protein n=1 Tax=Bosea sp. RAF48 TaxID=3237480 RepID=UPI003F8FECDB